MNKEEIILEIKKTKKYKDISEDIITKETENYFRRNPSWRDHKCKFIIKEIKARLHDIHGSYQTNNKANKKKKYLEELKNNLGNLNIINKLLKTNRSSTERLEFYKQLYEKLFEITGKPNSISDLGCGLNPISVVYMPVYINLNNLTYYSYDINEEDNNIINEFFKIKRINGKSFVLDCSSVENLRKIPNADVCFMFKFIDTIENNEKGHKLAENIIKYLFENDKCKFIVASFATSTIGGARMNFANRGWIERMLERVGFGFKKLEFKNEVFYIISR
jgi:16S rRNA (guanine(1405)-N(7))-methyltransferase